MPFQKGNKLGIKGRTPSKKTQLKRFEERHPEAYDQLMEVLFQSGKDGHSLDAQYVIDRIRGKPKATVGVAEEDKALLTAQTVIEFMKLRRENAIQGQIEETGSSTVINVKEEEEGVNIRG